MSNTPTIHELRRRARELGVESVMSKKKEELLEDISAAEREASGSSDFSDLGEVKPAPDAVDEVGADDEDETPKVEPSTAPKPVQRPVIRLSSEEVAASIKTGKSSGIPATNLQAAKAIGDEVFIGSKRQEVTGAIAGHAARLVVETRSYIVEWTVEGSADDVEGKLRLMNDVTMVMDGCLHSFRAGKEFFPHQLDADAIRAAGGVVIPLSNVEDWKE